MGNVSAGGGRTIQWTPDNRISQLTKGSGIAAQTTSFTTMARGKGEEGERAVDDLVPIGDDYEVTNGLITKYCECCRIGVIARGRRAGPLAAYGQAGLHSSGNRWRGSIVLRRTYRPYGDKIAIAPHTSSRADLLTSATTMPRPYVLARSVL
jgi:hypothetical protein